MRKKLQPKSSLAEQELDKVEKQFEAFDKDIKEMTMDRMSAAPKKEEEQQTKLSSQEIDKSKDIYLKPIKSLGVGVNPKTGEREKFNEKFRSDYNYAVEYVRFVAENKEILGETIELWTKPFPGMACEFWKVPCNKPLWGPRHLAERLTGCKYHRLVMNQNVATGGDEKGNQYFGAMAVDTTIQRLDAIPVSARKSIFMGAGGF